MMQDWYVHTANTGQPQTKMPSVFLADQQLELPQISPEHQNMLTEKITSAEVEDSINEAHEIRAPGPSITLYKLLFQY